MKKRKLFAWALALSMLVTSVGCSNSDNGDTSGGSASEPSASKTGEKANYENNFGIDPNVEATLEIWAWDEGGIKTIFDGLNKLYPNIKYNYVSVASADYLVKTQTAAAAGERVSDIVKGDGVWRGQALNLGIFANLEADPYNLDRSVIQEYAHSFCVDDNGDLVGIQTTAAPSGLGYRADMAEKYFGTSDPAELEAKLTDWDTILEEGKRIYQESGGKVRLFSGAEDVYYLIAGQNTEPFVKDGALNIEASVGPAMKYILELKENNLVYSNARWTPAWSSSYADGSTMFFVIPTWAVRWEIEEYDPEGAAAGLWRMMQIPGGSINDGGTTEGIWVGTEHPEACLAYLTYTLTHDYAKEVQPIQWMSVGSQAYTDDDPITMKADSLGGMDIVPFYLEAMTTIHQRPVASTDAVCEDAIKLGYQAIEQGEVANYEDVMNIIADEIVSQDSSISK